MTSNDGLQYALLALIYQGSVKYPYNRFLDNLSYRLLGDRPSATPGKDYTSFYTSVAGQGYLQLLPVFLDQILYPTLKQEDFLTKVHYVTVNGTDAGVQYNKAQVSYKSEI